MSLCLTPALALTLALTVVGCGNKRPPKPPPRIVPAPTTNLEVAQRGSELQFAFAYPAVTVGGLPLDGLEAVELRRMTRPLQPPPLEEEDAVAEEADEDEEPDVEEMPAEQPPSTPFLFRRPTTVSVVRAEERIEVDPREFLALAEVEQRIEGAELQAAISGDRVLLRLPLGALPAPEVPEEERDIELFAVITVSSRGLGSELSNVVKILPRTPPAPPSQIETRPGAEGINLTWRAEDPPVGFRVYRRDAASRSYGTPIAQPSPEARSHLDQTAGFDSSYVYSVTTVALEAPLVESALTAEREVQYEDRYPPTPPGGVIVLAEPGRARVLWEPTPATDLAGYLVYRRTTDGSGFDRLTAEPGRELEYLDTTVASGRGYSYYVSAVDTSGNESEASQTVDVEVP
ncbi:MAG: fibronectin type III domain-containing protein [Thermoanaerobaculia bacterium]